MLHATDSRLKGGVGALVWLNGSSGSAAGCNISETTTGGLYIWSPTRVDVEDCNLSGNRRYGIYGYSYRTDGKVNVKRCLINNNQGGGVYLQYTDTVIENCLIVNNRGDGFYQYSGNALLNHCTIASNTSDGVDVANRVKARVYNSIIYANQRYGLFGRRGQTSSDYNLIYGNRADFYDKKAGPNTLLLDPVFESKSSYQLDKTSPAIDEAAVTISGIANVTDDLERDIRPQGAGPDIGCYESDYQNRVRISTWKEVR